MRSVEPGGRESMEAGEPTEPEGLDPLRRLGEELRRGREARGLTLDQAQVDTKIRLRYLRALETGDFDQLPGEVYVKGFLRAYADYLGLDGPGLVERYKAWRRERQPAGEGAAEGEGEGEIPRRDPDLRRAPRRGRRQRQREAPGGRRRAAQVVVLLVVLLAAYGLWAAWSARSPRESPPGGGPQGGAAGAAPTPDAAPQGPGGAPGGTRPEREAAPPVAVERRRVDAFTYEYTVHGATALEVRASVSKDCWVQVQADGRALEEGTLRPGDARTWTARDQLVVRAGRPDGLQLTVNGREQEPLPAGEPLWLRFRRGA